MAASGRPAPSAALNTNTLAQKPENGGRPSADSEKAVMASAMPGCSLNSPAMSSIVSIDLPCRDSAARQAKKPVTSIM